MCIHGICMNICICAFICAQPVLGSHGGSGRVREGLSCVAGWSLLLLLLHWLLPALEAAGQCFTVIGGALAGLALAVSRNMPVSCGLVLVSAKS